MKHILFVLALLLIALIVHHHWILEWGVLTHGDWGFHYSSQLCEEFKLPTIWQGDFLGGVNIGLPFYPFQLISAGLSCLNIPYAVTVRLVFIFPLLLAGTIGCYFFFFYLLRSRSGAFVSSLLYFYTTYFLNARTGHLTLLNSFMIAPVFLLFYIKFQQSKRLRDLLLAALFGFIVSFYEFRGFFLSCVICGLFYVVSRIRVRQIDKGALFTLSSLLTAAYPILLIGILNLYWIVGFANMGALQSNVAFDRGLFGNEFLHTFNGLTMFHPFWTGGKPAEFEVQPIPVFNFLLVLLVLIGIYLGRKHTYIIFFGLLALTGAYLSKQSSYPLPWLYEWLYFHLPGFNAFREGSKFFFYSALGYAVCIGYLCSWIVNQAGSKFKLLKQLVVVVMFSTLAIYQALPLVTGEVGTLFINRAVPEPYLRIEQLLSEDSSFSRVLWIPADSRWSYYSDKHPKLNAMSLAYDQWSTYIPSDVRESLKAPGDYLLYLLRLEEDQELLLAYGIKYLAVPAQNEMYESDFFRYFGIDRSQYLDLLDRLPFLSLVSLSESEIKLYEVKELLPRATTFPDKREVVLKRHNDALYNFSLKDYKEPVYFHFSEQYHPDWKISVNSGSFFRWLVGWEEVLPTTVHTHTTTMTHVFYLDPSEFKAGEYHLYFNPQRYVYIGMILSVIFFPLTILLYIVLRKNGTV